MTVTKGLGSNSHAMHHVQIQIADRRLLIVFDVTASLQQSAPSASEQDRQVIVIVFVPVADSTSVANQYVIQQTLSVPLIDLRHTRKHPRKQLHVVRIDFRNFL